MDLLLNIIFIGGIVFVCVLIVFDKEKKRQQAEAEKAEQKKLEKELLAKAEPYVSLDKKYGVLAVKKCCPEVGNALKIVKHYTRTGIQHPSTYTLTMVSVGGVTTGGITEHKGRYDESFSATDKAKLIYDNFVIEKIQLSRSDTKRARNLGFIVDDDGLLNVTNQLNEAESRKYLTELSVAADSEKNKGYSTNSYEAMRFQTFDELKRILEFVATPS